MACGDAAKLQPLYISLSAYVRVLTFEHVILTICLLRLFAHLRGSIIFCFRGKKLSYGTKTDFADHYATEATRTEQRRRLTP